MLNLRTAEETASLLGCTEDLLWETTRRVDALSVKLTITDLTRPDKKPREVYDPIGPLRALQKNAFLPRLDRFSKSHGGVRGRSQLTCVTEHANQQFVCCADIQSFYPSIHFERIRGLFLRLGCSEEVALILTRLCTHHNRLEQGFITSPILADRLFRGADKAILHLCTKYGLRYTRYVDDITISGPFNLEKSGFPGLVGRILRGKGFKINADKDQFGSIPDGDHVLGLRLTRGRPDVSKAYYDETVRRLDDMAALGRGVQFTGPYFTRAELYGRIRYVCWVNRHRLATLMPLWRSLDWDRIQGEAGLRGIVAPPTRFRVERCH